MYLVWLATCNNIFFCVRNDNFAFKIMLNRVYTIYMEFVELCMYISGYYKINTQIYGIVLHWFFRGVIYQEIVIYVTMVMKITIDGNNNLPEYYVDIKIFYTLSYRSNFLLRRYHLSRIYWKNNCIIYLTPC